MIRTFYNDKKEYTSGVDAFYIITNAIVHNAENQILLIKTNIDNYNDQLYLPGGFINHGEKIEDALNRIIKRTVGLIIEPLEVLGVYSDFDKDPNNHIISVVFICLILDYVNDTPEINSDGKEKIWINLVEFNKYRFLYDHRTIIEDYIKWRQNNSTFWSSKTR